MLYRPLASTGLQVSVLGFGAATLGNEYGTTDRAGAARAVAHAIERGINFFDVSPYYGRTLAEERLGEALLGLRERVVLATKCGRYDVAAFDFRAERVQRSLEESLQRLRTDRVELFQLHDVEFVEPAIVIEEALPALAELKRAGKCRAIGITGYPLGHLRRLIERSPVALDTVLSYARATPLCDDLGAELLPYACARGMSVLNASPLHMGALTPQGPPPWHKADPSVLAAARRMVEALASRGLDAPTVALRYALAETRLTSTFVGLSTEREVDQNLRALEQPLDAELRAELVRLAGAARNRPWVEGLLANNP
jgi:L-galactose dehydrogenase